MTAKTKSAKEAQMARNILLGAATFFIPRGAVKVAYDQKIRDARAKGPTEGDELSIMVALHPDLFEDIK